MTVYKIKRTGRWRYDFQVRGKRYTCHGFLTAKAARQAEHDRRREIEQNIEDPLPTFGKLVAAWIDCGAMSKSCAHLAQAAREIETTWGHLADLHPRELVRGHFEPTLVQLARTRKANTVNKYRANIIACLNYGVAMGALSRNPAAGIPKVPLIEASVEPIPTLHLQRLIMAADGPHSALMVFISQTGCRWIETARLKWSEVYTDRPEPFCLLRTRKRRGGHERVRPQPLTGKALTALDTMRGYGTDYVFGRYRMAQYSTDLKRLARLCDRVGMPRYGYHQIRHWTGLVASQMGRSKKAVANYLGHTDTSATERYMHAMSPELWAIARQLEREIDDTSKVNPNTGNG